MTSFTDRARLFIQTGTEDQKSLLRECMEANNLDALRAVQMLSKDMYGGITFNYELKAPAAVCLIRWGEEGLNALIEAAERTKASKNNSLALDILASLASCAALPEFAEHFVDEL